MPGQIIVPVAPGADTSVPGGVEYGAPYQVIGPDGTRVVFNDLSDADYIGMLTEVTGLDSPDVRESADDLVQMDGGIHGDFFYGRRPITMSGILLNPTSTTERNLRITKLQRATNALREDCTVAWQLSGAGANQFISARRQQPLRVTGGWQKSFQIALVAADPRIYSTDAYSATIPYGSSQVSVNNSGNTPSWPIFTIYGPGVTPTIQNYTTGDQIVLNYTLGASEQVTVDALNRTVLSNDSFSKYGTVDFDLTSWISLVPGSNDIRFSFASGSASPAGLAVQWRDAWI